MYDGCKKLCRKRNNIDHACMINKSKNSTGFECSCDYGDGKERLVKLYV